jgi:hypothetical protein
VGIILTAAGEEAQIDYGSGPMVRDPQSGKYRRTRLFVLTLGYSRKSVRLLVWRSSSQIWAELHEKAFRRWGGSPRIVVLDNLREGVIVADIYDPTLNRKGGVVAVSTIRPSPNERTLPSSATPEVVPPIYRENALARHLRCRPGWGWIVAPPKEHNDVAIELTFGHPRGRKRTPSRSGRHRAAPLRKREAP